MTTTILPPAPASSATPPLTPARRVTLVAGLLLSVVMISSGVLWLVQAGSRTVERLTFTLSPAGQELTVDTAAGDIVVAVSDDDRVHVTRTARFGGSRPTYTEQPDGAGNTLAAHCSDGWMSIICRVDYEVAVPAGMSLQLRSESGDITASDVGGALDAASDNGDLHAHGVTGALRLSSHNGGISADGVRSAEVAVATDNGDIDLRFADAPSAVTANSDNGDVTLLLPAGVAYAVDAGTGNGSTDIRVATNPTSTRTVQARSDNGDVHLTSGS